MSNVDKLISRYPKLYHMAESGSWPSIQKHGLLSTTGLLDLFEINGVQRFSIESQWREGSITIRHPEHGTAVIRDQKPMPPESLEQVLVEMTCQQWYELLNAKTFFWVTIDRLNRLLNARLYRNKPHDIITLDTRSVVSRHIDSITLSSINSGVSAFGPKYTRGADLFKRIEDYDFAGTRAEVVELAVTYCVPDISELAIAVHRYRGSTQLETVWQR